MACDSSVETKSVFQKRQFDENRIIRVSTLVVSRFGEAAFRRLHGGAAAGILCSFIHLSKYRFGVRVCKLDVIN
jgi:hypothetical protein